MNLYIVQMPCYLNIVQMGRNEQTGTQQMNALTAFGRFFDTTVAVAFVLISLSLAGATAVVGV